MAKTLTTIKGDWFDESIRDFQDKFVEGTRHLQKAILIAWKAHERLSAQGTRNDRNLGSGEPKLTWNGWMEKAGVPRSTGTRWIKMVKDRVIERGYTPDQINELGFDDQLIELLMNPVPRLLENTMDEARTEKLIKKMCREGCDALQKFMDRLQKIDPSPEILKSTKPTMRSLKDDLETFVFQLQETLKNAG